MTYNYLDTGYIVRLVCRYLYHVSLFTRYENTISNNLEVPQNHTYVLYSDAVMQTDVNKLSANIDEGLLFDTLTSSIQDFQQHA